MKNVIITIPDMQSAHCQMRVSNAIKSVGGATINSIEPGTANLTLENDKQYDEVVKAIENAGYTVGAGEPNEQAGEECETFQFKTNINCGGCISAIRPFLDRTEGICHWNVDTGTQDKILSVHSDGISRDEVIKAVNRAGFKAEPLSNNSNN